MRWVWLSAAVLIGITTHEAPAYTGGPVRARVLGYDAKDAKVFYELQAFDESGYPPRTYFFDLKGRSPTTATHAVSLDDWEGGMRVREASKQWLKLYRRLAPLQGMREAEFTVRVHAESTGVDSAGGKTRFAAQVEISTPKSARTLKLEIFCRPVVRVQGIYTIPRRNELLMIVSYIGRSYGCEEVDLPLLLVPKRE